MVRTVAGAVFKISLTITVLKKLLTFCFVFMIDIEKFETNNN